jgi:hypothetical protein
MTVSVLHDLDLYLSSLQTDTVELIPMTKKIVVIKNLVTLHDLFDLSVKIRQEAKVIDLAAVQEMGSLRLYLQLYHRLDFTPVVPFDSFNAKLLRFIRLAEMENPKISKAKFIVNPD